MRLHTGLLPAGVAFLDRQPRSSLLLSGLALVFAVGLLDLLTGPEAFFYLFYLVPISLGAWCGGKRVAIVLALASGLVWGLYDTVEHTYGHTLIHFWNSLILISFFLLTAVLLARLRRAFDQLEALAATDPLTGVLNGRAFYAAARRELARARRGGRALTIAYTDLDNFKFVNDRYGHAGGDALLCRVADVLTSNVRTTDLVARLGGDEFAVLLPEADAEGALALLARIRDCVLTVVSDKQAPVTLTVGAVTFRRPPADLEEGLRRADALLYEAKGAGKDCIRHEVVEEGPATPATPG